MTFKDFLKAKLGLLVFNFIFILFTILVLLFSPIEETTFDTISYIIIVNIVLLFLYLLISYFRKIRFLSLLDEDIYSTNFNKISMFKKNKEEDIYLEIIKNYQVKYDNILNDNLNKFEENKEIMSMWVHDIKIPISIIKLIIEQNENPYLEKILDEIDNEVMRIENSVERVLYLSRLEDFHKDFLIQEVNLEKVIREVIRKYSKYFIYNKIQLSLENIDFNILSDKKWLLFIFDQLIGNSLKYTNKEDSISLYGEKSGNYIKIHIRDTGYGIKKEDLNRIFNKGFTGNNGRNNAKSTGLGLYLVKELCNKLDHSIDVNSVYGEFTEFIITLKENI